MIKTLLLNDDLQVIAFISERKAVKLLLKQKVDILSIWHGNKIHSVNGYIEYPATLRLRYHIRLNPTKLNFSRKLVLRRDNYTCGYCRKKFNNSSLTIDHVVPKSAGGGNSFSNCVTACLPCNSLKRNRTPEQAGMILRITPTTPNKYLCYFPTEIEWHADWLFFL